MAVEVSTTQRKSPNILLIVTDQHRSDFLSCFGNQILSTPHIDSIAARGVSFDRCFVAAPVCMPNRASLVTGRMPSVHGVRVNGIPLSTDQTTFVEVLRAAGYRTALVGKSHLQNMMTDPPLISRPRLRRGLIPPPVELSEARQCGSGRYDRELSSSWRRGKYPTRGDYYGFEYSRLVTGHGDCAGGDYLVWLARQRQDYAELRGQASALPSDVECPEAWRTAVPEELYPTSYIASEAIRYVSRHAQRREDAPFFLMVSFPDPHHPFTPPGRYWSMYDAADMKLPPNFHPNDAALAQVKYAHAQLAREGRPGDGYGATAVSERGAREAMALTCGMIAMIDDAVGEILSALSSLGVDEETLVVFTSDHGDFLGDHGLLRKGPLHFQSVIRVPLIIAQPKSDRSGDRTRALTSTIDIAATLLDLAGLESYNGMQGRTLRPVLEGQTRMHREHVLIEEDAPDVQLGWTVAPRLRTIVSGEHRLTLYDASAQGELFDLARDPFEMSNLWGDETARDLKSELIERLARVQMDMADTSPWPRSLA